jgi:hypothetical protein
MILSEAAAGPGNKIMQAFRTAAEINRGAKPYEAAA